MLVLPLLTALVAGFTHALEPDHMAAVTTFVSRRPGPVKALGFGVRWGVGHSIALIAVGGVLILLDLQVPETIAIGLEFGVGAMLAGLGVWVLGGALHRSAFEQAHHAAHENTLPHSHHHPHGHSTLWVGMAHGLAGTAAFLTLIPLTLLSSPWMAAGYLLSFGIGTVVAMGMYALAAGYIFHQVGDKVPQLGRMMQIGTGIATLVLGLFWMYGAAIG
ncbi:MAG TPA: sulfite exporter TauE/SafE family protein [Longimicrobiaceae bacterium]|nr:sulfite exporter TauE/SafE family protein [Longimicrobiaceae bacterium]